MEAIEDPIVMQLSGWQKGVARTFRAAALIEASTWLGLLVGMAFKYVVGDTETGVKIFGPIHGAAFIAYVISTCVTARTFRWPTWLLLIGFAASIPPAATWPFERRALRRGRLGLADSAVTASALQ